MIQVESVRQNEILSDSSFTSRKIIVLSKLVSDSPMILRVLNNLVFIPVISASGVFSVMATGTMQRKTFFYLNQSPT